MEPAMQPIDSPAALSGLVVAGGDSRRMGRDKGSLEYDGATPQVRRAYELLASVCGDACVAVRRDQLSVDTYRDLPLIVDAPGVRGPAAGLLGGWDIDAERAWLVLAVDLPFVDAALLGELCAGRKAARLATAFAHPDGTPEPLCTIWEPAARPVLAARVAAGDRSLRRVLEMNPIERLEVSEPGRLRGIDTAADYARARLTATGAPPDRSSSF
jgi:molybdenum cofactor guanylyltransferase